MPLRKHIRHLKDKVFGSRSKNASTSSLPNMGQTSPSPQSSALPPAVTPSAQTPIPSVPTNLPDDGLSPGAVIVLAHSTTTSIDSLSNVVVDPQPPAATVPPPSLHKASVPTKQKSSLEHAKSTAWAGLKTLLKVLESSADAFGPLKSAIGGLNQCIDIYEVGYPSSAACRVLRHIFE